MDDNMETVDLAAPSVILAPVAGLEDSSNGIPVPSTPTRSGSGFIPLVTVVGFHHAR
jgi:hypothetical protein